LRHGIARRDTRQDKSTGTHKISRTMAIVSGAGDSHRFPSRGKAGSFSARDSVFPTN
jgi:hypothetical protein